MPIPEYQHRTTPDGSQAFTLVELAIVLVIIGLLVGGVLAGRSLIRSAEIRGVVREFNDYKVALIRFQDKYQALPGDMPNAIRYWGAQATSTTDGWNSDCPLNSLSPATDARTCNGDGNYLINLGIPASTGFTFLSDTDTERFRAWQHLANAGLITGTYTGVRGNAGLTPKALARVNVPGSRMNGGGWGLIGAGNVSSPNYDYIFPANYGGASLTFGATSLDTTMLYPILEPLEAYDIDTKVDDGIATRGKVITRKNTSNAGFYHPDCLTGSDTYNMTLTSPACSLIFITGM